MLACCASKARKEQTPLPLSHSRRYSTYERLREARERRKDLQAQRMDRLKSLALGLFTSMEIHESSDTSSLDSSNPILLSARHFVKMLQLDVHLQHHGKAESALVMELLGKDLGRLFEENGRKFSAKTVLMIAIQLLECLEQLHAANILHCDLKPENFLVGRKCNNQDWRIFVVDFGMAKVTHSHDSQG